MAVVWMDGFEIDFPNSTVGLWDVAILDNVDAFHYTNVWSRTGNGSLYLAVNQPTGGASCAVQKILPANYTELYFGFAFRTSSSIVPSSSSTGGPNFFHTYSSDGSYQISLARSPGGFIQVLRGGYSGTIIGVSSNTIMLYDRDYYIDVHIIISDTVGVVEVKIDGATEINLTNVDTNNSGGDIRRVAIGTVGNSGALAANYGAYYYDDFVVCDTTGTVSNSWVDGAGIELLNPNADGTHSDWTSTGVNDYTEINDFDPYGSLSDGDTTNLSSNIIGQRTSVELTNMTLAGSIRGIMLFVDAKNDGAGLDEMTQFVRVAGADYDSSSFVPPSTYYLHTDILTLNPATAAQWLTAEVNAMEQGVLRVT